MGNYTPRPVPQAKPQPLTPEEQKQKIMQFLAQKREQFSINILCNMVEGSLDDIIKHSDAPSACVKMAVKMADQLMEALYPMPEETKEEDK